MQPEKILKQYRNELVLYDHATEYLARCERVDEVREIRNRAHAIEVYSAQALNYEMEHKAARIRLRAERRCGELLKEAKKNGTRKSDGRPKKPSDDTRVSPKTLAELGITYQQASDWQKLADVPKDKFEERLQADFPSTAELIREDKKPTDVQPIPPEVLFIWGRICDFERHQCFEQDPAKVYEQMLDTMREDVVRVASPNGKPTSEERQQSQRQDAPATALTLTKRSELVVDEKTMAPRKECGRGSRYDLSHKNRADSCHLLLASYRSARI